MSVRRAKLTTLMGYMGSMMIRGAEKGSQYVLTLLWTPFVRSLNKIRVRGWRLSGVNDLGNSFEMCP